MSTVVRNMVSILGISDELNTYAYIPNFKEFSVTEMVTLPCNKPDIEKILSVAFDLEILSIRIANTPVPAGKSNADQYSSEGEALTGKKMIVELKIKQKMQYVADEQHQTIHAHHNEYIVSEYIVIPNSFKIQDDFYTPEVLLRNNMFIVTPYLEDANVRMLDERTICKNLTIFINIDTKRTFDCAGTPMYPIF